MPMPCSPGASAAGHDRAHAGHRRGASDVDAQDARRGRRLGAQQARRAACPARRGRPYSACGRATCPGHRGAGNSSHRIGRSDMGLHSRQPSWTTPEKAPHRRCVRSPCNGRYCPTRRALISSRVGFGLRVREARSALMSMPGKHMPHWTASCCSIARCNGDKTPSCDSDSTVSTAHHQPARPA